MTLRKKESEVLEKLFGDTNDIKISKKLIEKLVQYNMKYEEITKVILTHSEREFLDARLSTAEEYYEEIFRHKTSEVEKFLESLPNLTKVKTAKKRKTTAKK